MKNTSLRAKARGGSPTRMSLIAWFEGKPFSANPFPTGTCAWCEWATEWGRLQDERNDEMAEG